MKLNNQEKDIVRRKFCAYCIKVLRGEALNYFDELKRKQKREINFSDFFRISLLKLVNEKKMPFSIDVPNQETARAMQAADEGDVTYHESVSSYFRSRGK